jgi:hypothetical protein
MTEIDLTKTFSAEKAEKMIEQLAPKYVYWLVRCQMKMMETFDNFISYSIEMKKVDTEYLEKRFLRIVDHYFKKLTVHQIFMIKHQILIDCVQTVPNHNWKIIAFPISDKLKKLGIHNSSHFSSWMENNIVNRVENQIEHCTNPNQLRLLKQIRKHVPPFFVEESWRESRVRKEAILYDFFHFFLYKNIELREFSRDKFCEFCSIETNIIKQSKFWICGSDIINTFMDGCQKCYSGMDRTEKCVENLNQVKRIMEHIQFLNFDLVIQQN